MKIEGFYSIHDRLVRAKLSQEQSAALRQTEIGAWKGMQEKTNKVTEKILADAEMVRVFGLENKSVDEVSKIMLITSVPYSKDEISKIVDEKVNDNFRLKAGHLGHTNKLKEMLTGALVNDTALNKYFNLISEILAHQ